MYRLTKSKYLTGMQCPKALWLQSHHPELADPISISQERIFRQGTEVGIKAQKLFPDGTLISAEYNQTDLACKQTEAALKNNSTFLFEPCFIFDNTLVRVDVLKNNGSNRVNIIEVKSTTGVHTEHIWDLAVQKYVLEGNGFTVEKSILMHLNNQCTYPDLSDLFILEDCSEDVSKHLLSLPKNLHKFQIILESEKEVKENIGSHCTKPYTCAFKSYCFRQAEVKETSIFNIPRFKSEKLDQLIDRGIVDLSELPDNFPLSTTQAEFVHLYKTEQQKIDYTKIREVLASLQFPLYFLDFETNNPAIPQFEGTQPYSQVPFQYSLHVLNEDLTLKHCEYLHTGKDDPRKPLAEQLAHDLGSAGTIIAYNAGFEKRVIRELAEIVKDESKYLLSFIDRFWDLLDIFRNYYKDPRFNGSNSIKAVLPVLCPHLSYSSLEVQNGTAAQATWEEMLEADSQSIKLEMEKNLKQYCKLDTLAMVELFKVLTEL